MKMGNNKSKAKHKQKPVHSSEQPGRSAKRNILQNTKNILLVHHSDTEGQKRIVKHFRRALEGIGSPSVEVKKTYNVSNPNGSELDDSSWLDEVDNVVLICLKEDAIAMLGQLIGEKGYIKDDRLLGKVFTVTFGARLQWPPDGVGRGAEHARDFAFDFENVENLMQKDFEESHIMNSLVAAMQ